ncbi:MAG: cell division protein FtsZ [Candidatus Bipolaricaulota bacterium]|nr:cell division protein FtsZ [Candidatus Bipolaricaulota bacterium]
MDRSRGKDETAQKWRDVLAGVRDQMLRACLPIAPDKVRRERDALVIEIDSPYKREYVLRKLPKLREAVEAVFGPVAVQVVEPRREAKLPFEEPEPPRPVPAPAPEPPPEVKTPARILVLGIGGGGVNALHRMREAKLAGVRLAALDTDRQVLAGFHGGTSLLLGERITGGRSAGGDPDKARQAAEAAAEEIEDLVSGAHLVFLTCGLGKGTGTGCAPVVAQIARARGALTVGVVTLPFSFEGEVRMGRAQAGLARLAEKTDVLIVIRNDRLLEIAPHISVTEAFELADEVLLRGVRGISDLITVPGLVNLDFADVASVLRGAGTAMMGTGEASGENRALRAAKAAVTNPLIEGGTIKGARRVLLNITGGEDLTLSEVTQIAESIRRSAAPEADITFGAVVRPQRSGSVEVTVIAADFGETAAEEEEKEERARPVIPRRKADDDFDVPTFLRRPGET